MRWPLYALPIVAVFVVALALVTAGSTAPYRVARLWGGPTDGRRLSLRVEVFDIVEDLSGNVEELVVTGGRIGVRARAGAWEAARSVVLDAEGGGEVLFELPERRGSVDIAVVEADTVLAAGAAALSAERWASVARRRGGWSSGHAGTLTVRIAPARGVLAVPFEEELLLAITQSDEPVADRRVLLRATGARITPDQVRTDGHGRASVRIAPQEHTVSVTVAVEDGPAREEVRFGLPVVPGALRAELAAGELVVEAPVPRETAYFALVTESERLLGGVLRFAPEARGAITARVELPALPVPPTHAVISSDRDLRSTAAVGWPLAAAPGAEPRTTFDAVDALLLDGRPRAALRERQRRSRVRWVTAAFCAAAVLIEIALLLGLTRTKDRALDRHLENAGLASDEATKLAPKRSTALIGSLLLIALGFLIVAIAGIVRLR